MAATETTTAKNMIDPKVTARHQLEVLRSKLDPIWIQQQSDVIKKHLIERPEFRDAKTVGIYLALPREVQTEGIIQACREANKRLCVPAYHAGKSRYEMCLWDPSVSLQKGKWGIAEPSSPTWIALKDIDVMIIPAVGFDTYGRRLGRGGGHFDQLLADHHGLKICLAFEYQKMTAVPFESHDVPVDLIITEKKVYETK